MYRFKYSDIAADQDVLVEHYARASRCSIAST